MGSSKIKGKDLKKINYTSNEAISLAMAIMAKNFKYLSKEEKLAILANVLLDPQKYLADEQLGKLANALIKPKETYKGNSFNLEENPKSYKVYGKQFIDENTLQQMDVAMRLPIAVKGALMPDAHSGYGLPIGGVLATENAVIPYGVGVDIGCRMSLSIYEAPAEFINKHKQRIKTALQEQTHFGIGKLQESKEDHEVLDRQEFKELDLLKKLHGKARNQIGTSGSGNHFVEAGIVELGAKNQFGFEEGNYLGVLAHSGSRGLGATIANYYTRVAIETCKLPKVAQQLAWLDLDTEEGMEYWLAMNLAGDYAKACHDVIHKKMAYALGLTPKVKVENHHNFAWKEIQADGKTLVIHRKGATPAEKGRLGIIPATMMDPGYIVSGKGNNEALASASHGAGRKMSRTKAKNSITESELKKMLKSNNIILIGGGLDEAPMAYKNLEEVMAGQQGLVNIEGRFYPKIVRMDKN